MRPSGARPALWLLHPAGQDQLRAVVLLPPDSELPDQCSPDPCDKEGTQVCQDLMGNFYCQCRDGWGGRLCDRGKARWPQGMCVQGPRLQG